MHKTNDPKFMTRTLTKTIAHVYKMCCKMVDAPTCVLLKETVAYMVTDAVKVWLIHEGMQAAENRVADGSSEH